MNSYAAMEPIEAAVPAQRQSAKRHYGVHPYFTRRPHNVVRKYILHYSREGDGVLDPFGGSGVTAIEAWLENRIGIHNDINPLANFIARGIVDLSRGTASSYRSALREIQERCEGRLNEIEGADDGSVAQWLASARLPRNVELSRTSDVPRYHDLFLPRQLLALAVLKEAVDSLKDRDARRGMLLAWSATLTKLNRTFLSAQGRRESRGGSSIFSIYRYKVAKRPVSLPAWKTFHERASNVLEAKQEIDSTIQARSSVKPWNGRFELYARDVEDLSGELEGRVDYVFTDPPYGGHIAYLDLSTLWNVWLGITPGGALRERELIVGGDLKLDEAGYTRRLGRSIDACARFLKPMRWMSVVFQHWNVAYFEAILNAAAAAGMDLRAAVSQVGQPIWSMHKKKGSQSVIAGEMILTFLKTRGSAGDARRGTFDLDREIEEVLGSVHSGEVYGEWVFNRLIVRAWRSGSIQAMNVSRTEFAQMIRAHGWNYDESRHAWVKDEARGLLPLR